MVQESLAPQSEEENVYTTWQSEYFTTTELDDENLEETVWGDTADPDQDGKANLLEYAQGSDPRVREENTNSLETIIIEDHYRVSFRWRANDTSLTRILETSSTLEENDWEETVWPEALPLEVDPTDANFVFISLSGGMTSDLKVREFLRLRATR